MEPPWHHDLMLSIHSYYVGEYATGIRSSERILSGNAPEGIKINATKNLSFYIKTIEEDFDVTYTGLKTDLIRNGWSLFNPTILNADNKIIALVRSSNYKIDNFGSYIYPKEDEGFIKTIYYKFELDQKMSVINISEVILPEYDKTSFPVDGLEDVRLFKSGDFYFVSGTIRNKVPYNGNCRIAIAKYDLLQNKIYEPHVISTDIEHEKNWMPIENCMNPKWIHHPNLDGRTSIISASENEDYNLQFNSCKFTAAKNFRGGSQLIFYNKKYYCLIHEVTIDGNNRRIYYHRFCEWDSDLNLLRYSKAFYLKESRTIEFAAGLSIKNEMVHVSFGLDDREAWIASFGAEEMLSLFFIDGKPV